MASSITAIHSLGQDRQNEVQHDLVGHVQPLLLTLASHDANAIVNDTTAFLKSGWSQWCAYDLFGHVMPLALVLVSNGADGAMNGIMAFLRSRWLKCSETWVFWSCDTICISITWYHWHMTLMPAPELAVAQKSYNTSKLSSQQEKCNAVIDSTISIMWQETCCCVEHAKS